MEIIVQLTCGCNKKLNHVEYVYANGNNSTINLWMQ